MAIIAVSIPCIYSVRQTGDGPFSGLAKRVGGQFGEMLAQVFKAGDVGIMNNVTMGLIDAEADVFANT